MREDKAEYIEKNEFYNIEKLLDTDVIRKSKEASWLIDQILHDIQKHPAADVAPVVHGKNITEINPVDEFICSECGVMFEDVGRCVVDNDGEKLYYEF